LSGSDPAGAARQRSSSVAAASDTGAVAPYKGVSASSGA
jgi:hypothetical protein